MGTLVSAICPVGDHLFHYEMKRGKTRKYCSPEHAGQATAHRQYMKNSQLTERHCPKCDTTKPADEFAGITAPYCKPCTADWARDRRAGGNAQGPEYTRKLNLARYGLTLEQFDEMLAAQGGRCKICHTDDPGPSGWQVDHDHSCCNTRKKSCGRCLRGILCTRCNIGIGNLRDDPDIILAALQYILAHRARSAGA